MKKEYIIPMLKSLNVYEEQLMLTASIEGENLEVIYSDGDAGAEGLGKSSIWDE